MTRIIFQTLISISDESEFEGLGEEDLDKDIKILLNKKPID